MKVLFIANAIAQYRIVFFQELAKLVDLDVLVTHQSLEKQMYGLAGQLSITGITVHYLDERRLSCKAIREYIGSVEWDVVILPPADSTIQFLDSLFSWKSASKRRIPTIYWCGKWEADRKIVPLKKRFKNLAQRIMIGFLAKNSAVCVTYSTKSKQYLAFLGVAPDKIVIAYNSSTSPDTAVDFSIRDRWRIPATVKIVLYLGRLTARKGCDDLIDAMKRVCQYKSDIVLLVGGNGDFLSACKERAGDLLGEKIIFCGKIPPEERKRYYEQSSLFVLPSKTYEGTIEAWGLTINESLECGTPVISTTSVGAAYDLLDGNNGRQIMENNITELADTIIHYVYEVDRTAISEHCKQVVKRFSVEQMANKFVLAMNMAMEGDDGEYRNSNTADRQS